MNRREFLYKTLATSLVAKLGNPYVILANSPRPERILYIFTRGGHDGLQVFHPRGLQINSNILQYLRQARPSLMLPDSGSIYNLQNVLPIGTSSQFGMHPWWERLRSENEAGSIPPSRIRCETVNINGQATPIDRFLAFRLMKGVGLLHEIPRQTSINAGAQPFNKSHFDMQQTAFLGLKNIAGGTGYLGKIVYHSGNELNDLFKQVGFGGLTQSELGGTDQRRIVNLSSSFSQINRGGGLQGYSLHSQACASYRQARAAWFDYWSGANEDIYKNLLFDLQRTDSSLHRLFKDSIEKISSIEDLSAQINMTLPNPNSGRSEDRLLFDQFRPWFYDAAGQPSMGNPGFITNIMYEIAKFFLYRHNTDNPSQALPNKRVAVLSIGNFDTHANQNTDLSRLIIELAGALHGLFFTIIREQPELLSAVKVIIVSEFGRTVHENGGQSTDHGVANSTLLIKGLPLSHPNIGRRYDREVGPTYTVDEDANINASVYARDIERTSLKVNRFHIFPKVSLLAGIMTLFERAFPEANISSNPSAFMELEFYQKNFLICDQQICLWNELLDGLP